MQTERTIPLNASVHSVPPVVKNLAVIQAQTSTQIAQARELFLEYAQSLELAALPGDYAPPDGRLLLAEYEGKVAGCVALHGLGDNICEMKRLYLRPEFRGKRLGRALAECVIAEARRIGYHRMRLDTVEPLMGDAVAMYRKMGFNKIPPYRPNPIAGAIYMELEL